MADRLVALTPAADPGEISAPTERGLGVGRRPPAADTLTAMMSRVQQGDEQAFADLYNATSRLVFGIVLRVLRNHAQAEEVAQEVYLEVWRTAVRYDVARGTTTAWLNVIAHRRAVDCVRSGERAARRDRGYQDLSDWDEPDPVDVVVSRQEASDVRRALDNLPPRQRDALLLAYFDGRSHREVAEILGVPLGTAKTRIRDAMRRLRSAFDLELSADRPSA